MIIFERVRYQNFLATGNVPIDIALNQHATTLIIGRNGAGKSTMTEAVCFALFGRALRNINKPTLINAINGRDALVELWFRHNEHAYYIKRGIKPNVFEIYRDQELIPPPASLSDYQTMLEEHILGMHYKSFMQIVVLGSASYVPFMRLTSAARREIVESLLDIEIFSTMSVLTKDELANAKSQIEQLTQQRTLLEEQKRMAETFTAHVTDEQEHTVALIEQQLAETQTTMQRTRDRIAELETAIRTYDEIRTACEEAERKVTEYAQTLKAMVTKEKKLQKEHEFYEAHDTCPTCAQMITEIFKQQKFTTLEEKHASLTVAMAQCQTLHTRYTKKIDEYQTALADAHALSQEQHTLHAQQPLYEQRVRQLTKERVKALEPKPAIGVDAEDIQRRLQDVITTHTDAARRKSVLDVANALLKDSGIKSRIINHYLPIINKQINTYLTAMDFPIYFTLDAEFEEHMQSRHRDDFTYDSFSEGEKKRIDLALLLTWRAIAQLKNNASCNLLVLDEVFDSSLDGNGTDEFLKIIQTLEKANVFVISHKDQMIDKFHHVLHFVKERGFSCLRA